MSRAYWHKQIHGLTDAEAVTYLLDTLSDVTADTADDGVIISDAAAREGVRIARLQALVLALLMRNMGHTLPYERIMSFVEIHTGRVCGDRTEIAQAIKHIRRHLKSLPWGVEIKTTYRVGYRAEATDDGRTAGNDPFATDQNAGRDGGGVFSRGD